MLFIVLLGPLVDRLANSWVVISDDNMTCYVQVLFPLYEHVLQMIPVVTVVRLIFLRLSFGLWTCWLSSSCLIWCANDMLRTGPFSLVRASKPGLEWAYIPLHPIPTDMFYIWYIATYSIEFNLCISHILYAMHLRVLSQSYLGHSMVCHGVLSQFISHNPLHIFCDLNIGILPLLLNIVSAWWVFFRKYLHILQNHAKYRENVSDCYVS